MDIVTKKSLGQHWLHDHAALEAMADAAEVKAGDHVLEIGPGLGTLTDVLAARGAHIISIEKDESLFERLVSEKIAKNLQFVRGDIRDFDLGLMPDDYKVVANIPYYLTANLLRLLADSPHKPSVTALLVQKEVAERVSAEAGEMSLLSVITQFYYEVTTGRKVPASLFTPPPKVDSQILVLKRRPSPLLTVEAKAFFRVVKAGFSARRKTLLNSLSGGLRLGKPEIRDILAAAEINPRTRPQELSLKDWGRIYENTKIFL